MRYLILQSVVLVFFVFAVQAHAEVTAKNEPFDTLSRYMIFLEKGDRKKMVPLYSKYTRPMMEKRSYSDAMMNNEARRLRQCGTGETIIEGSLAVIKYSSSQRNCSPYFFTLEESYWRLDFQTMSEVIAFDEQNQWHLDNALPHPYRFAF